jgi:Pyridine nucleotide-disulphide oxidoreductase/BFD-like [2Fe-2S] binding domain
VISPQVAVVGAGPAGLAAAGEARVGGARTLLIEERPALGGRAMLVPGARGLTEGLMRDLGTIDVWRGSSVWGVWDRTLSVLRGGRNERVTADAVILTTGAREWILPFPGWTLEGVKTLEAGWEAVRTAHIGPDSGPVIVTGRSDAVSLANRLAERGTATAFLSPERTNGLAETITQVTGTLSGARGTGSVEEIVCADGTAYACRILCVESPRAPAIELARQAGCPYAYAPILGGFVPRYDPSMALHGPAVGLYVAGDASGVDAPRAAAESGRLAARCALHALGILEDPESKIEECRRRIAAASFPLHARAREALMLGVSPDEVIEPWDAPAETIMCPCEGVALGELRAALDDGAMTPEDLMQWTRCGNGICQGRRCTGSVMRWLSGAIGMPIGRLPLPPVRRPIRAVPLATFSDGPPPDSGDLEVSANA